jgi:hypothetical protein
MLSARTEHGTEIAHRYRLVLQTCSNALYERFRRDAERGAMPEPDREAEYEELLQMDQVWSLCEIFFVREKHLRKHGGYVVQSLCGWVRQHFSSAQEEARLLLQTGEPLPPEGAAADVYWTVLFQLLFQVRRARRCPQRACSPHVCKCGSASVRAGVSVCILPAAAHSERARLTRVGRCPCVRASCMSLRTVSLVCVWGVHVHFSGGDGSETLSALGVRDWRSCASPFHNTFFH